MSRHRVDVVPTLEERLANMVHARIEAVVRMLDVVHHLLRVPAVRGRERLVPVREDVALGVGRGVLCRRG